MAAEVWVVYRVNPYEDRDLVAVFDHQPTREDLLSVLALNDRDEYSAEKFTTNEISDYFGRGSYHVSKTGGLFRYCSTPSGDKTYLEDEYHNEFGFINAGERL